MSDLTKTEIQALYDLKEEQYRLAAKIDIKDAVADGGAVWFKYYRDGNLYYYTKNQQLFAVPVKDVEGATLNSREKAIFFMRWMRKHNEQLDR